MSKVVYGIFTDRNEAEEALDHLEAVSGHHGTYGLVHEGEVDELPIGGTFSGRWALIAGAMVGVLGATFAALVLAPAAEVSFGVFEFLSISFAGTIFGMVGGAVSGSSEPLPALRTASAAVSEGQVLVTVDCDAGETSVVVAAETLAEHGATEAAAA